MQCPIIKFCLCSRNIICLYCLKLSLVVLSMLFGILIALKPKKTIELQIALYRPFNWKIEPISMEKEIRNTRLMGIALFICSIIALAYLVKFGG